MDEENAYTTAESAAYGFCGKVVRSGFLTTEAITSAGTGWSHSYFVLAGTSKADARLFRFLSPHDTTPQDHMRIDTLETNVHGEAVLLRAHGAQYLTVPQSKADREGWLAALAQLSQTADSRGRKAVAPESESGAEGIRASQEQSGLPLFLDAPALDPVMRAQVEESAVLRRECCAMDLARLRRMVFSGGLWNSAVRSICWRRLLGVLPADNGQWRVAMQDQRERYAVLRQRYMMRCTHDEAKEDVGSYLDRKVAEAQIWKDLCRTKLCEYRFSRDSTESAKQAMNRLLVIFAEDHPEIGYKQGMNELLAIVVIVFFTDYQVHVEPDEEEVDSAFQSLTDRQYLESDCYALFEAIMRILLPVYSPVQDEAESNDTSGLDYESRPTTLIKRMEHIQHVLLQRTDPELAAVMHTLRVEPHMYLVRWIRLLLAREIPMPQVLLVWDAIFAVTPDDFSMVDSISVALLTTPSYRDRLVKKTDHLSALQTLSSCPPLAEHQVGEVVYRGRKIHDAYEESMLKINEQIKIQRLQNYGRSSLQTSNSFEALLQEFDYH